MRMARMGPEGIDACVDDSPFGEQEAISSDAQRRAMMKAAPASSFVLAKTVVR